MKMVGLVDRKDENNVITQIKRFIKNALISWLSCPHPSFYRELQIFQIVALDNKIPVVV